MSHSSFTFDEPESVEVHHTEDDTPSSSDAGDTSRHGKPPKSMESMEISDEIEVQPHKRPKRVMTDAQKAQWKLVLDKKNEQREMEKKLKDEDPEGWVTYKADNLEKRKAKKLIKEQKRIESEARNAKREAKLEKRRVKVE